MSALLSEQSCQTYLFKTGQPLMMGHRGLTWSWQSQKGILPRRRFLKVWSQTELFSVSFFKIFDFPWVKMKDPHLATPLSLAP